MSMFDKLKTNGKNYSHTLITKKNNQKYTTRIKVNANAKAKFWRDLSDIAKIRARDLDRETSFTIAEKSDEVLPLMINMSFIFPLNDMESVEFEDYLNDEFIQAICEVYMKEIRDYGLLSKYEYRGRLVHKELIVFVLKSVPALLSDNNEIEFNVRLHFPFTRCTKETFISLKMRACAALRKNNPRSMLKCDFDGDFNLITADNNYEPETKHFMYTFPDERDLTYLVHKVYIDTIDSAREDSLYANQEFDELSEFNSLITLSQLKDLFDESNVCHLDIEEGSMSADIVISNPSDYLILILSMGFGKKLLISKNIEDTPKKITPTLNLNYTFEQELAVKFLDMISPHRYEKEFYWYDIGECLKKTFKGSDTGLDLWIRYTNSALEKLGRSEPFEFMMPGKYTLETMARIAYQKPSPLKYELTIKTLAWYAKIDNKAGYEEWHKNWTREALIDSLDCKDMSIAEAVFRHYWLIFVYVPNMKIPWYFYCVDTHRWYADGEGIGLVKNIATTIKGLYEELEETISEEIDNAQDEISKAQLQLRVKNIGDVISKLKEINFINVVLKALRTKFNFQQFYDVINTNPNVKGLENGVIQVYKTSTVFRSGKPEDYITMAFGCKFIETMTMEDERVKTLLEWLGKVFRQDNLHTIEDISNPNKNLFLRWYLKFVSSLLRSRNDRKLLPIFTGGGNNGKSMIVKKFSKLLFKYCVKMDITNLTGRNSNSAGATPQLFRLKNTALAIVDEAGSKDKLHNELVKRLTGGDSFYARGLFEEGGDIDVTCKSIVICNKPCQCNYPDKATRARIKIIKTKGIWGEGAPDTLEEQIRINYYPVKYNFEDDLDELLPACVFLMVTFYPILESEGLKDTEEIVNETNAYWDDNDVYIRFIKDNIRTISDKTVLKTLPALSVEKVHEAFKRWYSGTFPAKRDCPDKGSLEYSLTERWGAPSDKGWYGFVIIKEEDRENTEVEDDIIEKQIKEDEEIKQYFEPNTQPEKQSSQSQQTQPERCGHSTPFESKKKKISDLHSEEEKRVKYDPHKSKI